MNLFQNILDKAKSGANYLSTGQFGSDVFDIQQQAQQKQASPIQGFLNESKDRPEMQSKRNAVIQMIQNGEDDSFIEDVVINKMGYNPNLSLKERVGSAIGQRFQTMGESFGTEKTGFEKGLSYTKDVLMTPFDVVGGAIQPVVEPIVKPIVESEPVQAGLQKYGEFRQENPRLAQNIEAVGGIVSTIAPFTKTGQKIIKAPGKAVVQGVEKVAPKVVQGVKTGAEVTGNMVSAPFKSIYNTAKQYVGTPDEIAGIQSAIKPKQKVKNGVVQRSQKQIDNEIQLTNGIIRNKGVKPTDLETYATAQKDILKEIGGEIERLTGQPLDIDMTPSSSKLRQLANTREVQLLDTGDAQRLLKIADDLDANPRMSLADAEAMNQYINDVLRSTTSTASEAYKRGLQILVQDLRDSLDNAISNIPGEFKDLKRTYGAVRNVYGDTIARQIVFNRQNMGGLIDSFGAIEGFGNIMGGAGKIVTGKVGEGFVDIGKGVTQNAVGRFIKSKNDPNNIIRAIFEKGGKESIIPDIKTKPKAPTPLLPARATPRAIPLGKSQAEIIAESKKGLSPNIKRPDGNNTRNSTNSSPVLDMGTTKGSKQKVIKPKVVKPSPQVKPVEKTVIKPTEKKVKTNITRNEAIEKGFSDSAKARWDKGDFTMKERGEATTYLKSNYKGKEYTIDGKKYKVDAIDNRNEQVRLLDSEGNIIRVKTNKLPETKVTDKDIFDYYNGRAQKGYKTVLSPQKTVKPKK